MAGWIAALPAEEKDALLARVAAALMRRRKAWHYEREPRPGVSVIGAGRPTS
jgi:hypothetical protein